MRLLARNAESLFWLARYLERGASLSRVIEMQSSFAGHDKDAAWDWLLALHTDEERFRERFEPSADTIIAFYLTDIANSGSVRSSIHWARENARALRPFIPLDMWAQLNNFHSIVEAIGSDDIQRSQLPRTCSQIRAGCLAQIGIAEGLLYRDEGYQFFKLGLMIERADQTSRLLDVKFAQSSTAVRAVDPADDFVFWSTILRTVGAYQVFHRLEHSRAEPERVARFLAFNPSHPRSIGFCTREIADALQTLRAAFRLSQANAAQEACEVLMEGLQTAARDQNLLVRLHAFNDWVQRSLIAVSGVISAGFFETRVSGEPDGAPSGKKRPKIQFETWPATRSQNQQSQSQSQSQTQSNATAAASATEPENPGTDVSQITNRKKP